MAKRKRHKRHSGQTKLLLGISVILLTSLCVTLWLTLLPVQTDPSTYSLPDYVNTEHLLPINEYSRPGTKITAVNGIVVHYVANPGTTALQNRNYFAGLAESGKTYASSNFIIGLDGEILMVVPIDEVAYCSNKRNNDTISIECCHPDETGQFTEATYRSLVQLTTWLANRYDLSEQQILRHYDVTGKLCPLYFVEHPDEWAAFQKEVTAP